MRQGRAEHRVVGSLIAVAAGEPVVLVGIRIVTLVKIAVGNAVVCIGCKLLVASAVLDEPLEAGACILVVFELEQGIGQAVHCHAVVAGTCGQCIAVAVCRAFVLLHAEKCFAFPVFGIGMRLSVMLLELYRTVQILHALLQVPFCQLLCAKPVKHLLLCLQNIVCRPAYPLYRLQGHAVVLCAHIYLYQVLCSLLRMS